MENSRLLYLTILHLVVWPNHFSYIETFLELVFVILMLIKATYMYGS